MYVCVCVYSHKRAPEFTKQILSNLKGEIDNNTLVIGDFKTLLLAIDRSSRQEINKEMSELSHTLEQIHLVDM